MGDAAFLAAVDHGVKAAAHRTEPLTTAERLRLEARRAVAIAVEGYHFSVILENFEGTKH